MGRGEGNGYDKKWGKCGEGTGRGREMDMTKRGENAGRGRGGAVIHI